MSARVGAASSEAEMRRWDGLIDRYLRECEARGLARETMRKRGRELERLGAWLKRKRPRVVLNEVDADLVAEYVSARAAFRSRSTVSGVVSDVRNVGEFLVREGVWRRNPLRWMKGPKIDPRMQIPRRIGRAQLRAIWAAAGRRREEFGRYQAVAVLAILYSTGLRRGELERLNTDDWNRESGLLSIDGRKTGRSRQVPVSATAWRCIEAYLPHRHNVLESAGTVGERALIVSRAGQRLSGGRISQMVRSLAKEAGVQRVTLHQFRHSCASDLLEEGVSVAEVQRFLGHAAIESTVRYVQIADPERSAAIARHPVNDLLGSGSEVAS